MNVEEFVKTGGYKTVPNPNYKQGSKKNKGPKFIQVQDLSGRDDDPFMPAVNASIEQGFAVKGDDIAKYSGQGVTYNKVSQDLDAELADAQSNWTKAGNAILQTVVDEMVGGTVQGFADMAVSVPQGLAKLTDTILDKVFDVKGDKVQDALGMKDEDYSNPVSAKIEEWRETFRNEVAPVYADPNKDIFNGGLADFGWWMSNAPSILSSITLFIPTRAATAGVAKLGSLINKANSARKAERVIKNLQKADKLANIADVEKTERVAKELNSFESFVNNPINRARAARVKRDIGEGLLMRTIENYQEAHQTYQDVYATAAQTLGEMSPEEYDAYLAANGADFQKEGVDINDRDAVAKHIATKAADRTFAADYSNLIFDIIQLHAIRDVGRLAKNVTSPGVMKMHRDSKKMLGKSTTKAKEAVAKSRMAKIGENLKDFATGGAKQFLSQASEGVEEGINYIAQQEGITYGNTLLEKETDTTRNSFWNDRLGEYLMDSEFWESAFWGVAGGIVFGGLANTGTKAQIAHQNKKDKKRRAENEKTGEHIVINDDKTNPLNDYISLGEMPEVKAAKESISKRHHRANQLKQQIDTIKSGKHPFKKGQNGEPLDITGDEIEQAKATIEAIEKFRSEVAFDAINSGTYDLLVDYFKDKDVQQALVDMGVTTQDGIQEFTQETLNTLQNVRDMYSKELAQVNAQVTAINATKPEEGKIPLEYVTHIARANATRRLKINRIDRVLSELNAQKTRYGDDEDDQSGVFNTGNSIRLSLLMDTYGRLEADKNAVANDEGLDEWQRAENLAAIRNRQDAIMNAILDVAQVPYNEKGLYVTDENDDEQLRKAKSREQALGAALYAIRAAKTYKRLGDARVGFSYIADDSNPDFAKSDEELIKDYEHIFSDSKSSVGTLNQIARLIDSDLTSIIDTDNDRSLVNVNRKLFDLYTNIAELEISRNLELSGIARTQAQIKEKVDYIHNRFNGIRQAKRDKAQRIIRKLHAKYITENGADIEKAVIAAYQNDRREAIRLARENLTGTDENGLSDAEALIGALDVFNFSGMANEESFRYVMSILQKNAEIYSREEEINSIFSNRLQDTENEGVIDLSADGEEATTAQENGQNGQIAPTNQPPQAARQNGVTNVEVTVEDGSLKITPTSDGNPTSTSVPLTTRTDSTWALNVGSLERVKQTPFILNPELFGNITVDPLNPNVEIGLVDNPLVEKDTDGNYVVVRQGRIIAINKETNEEIDAYGAPEEEGSEEGNPPQPEPTPAAAPITPPPTPVTDESQEGEGDNAPISPTGEEPVRSLTPAQIDEVIGQSIDRALNGGNIDDLSNDEIDALAPTIKHDMEGGISAGAFTEEELDNAIADYLASLKEDIFDINSRDGIDKEAARLALSARYEEPDTNDFSNLFVNAAKSFIEEYKKVAVVKEIDGKTAVRVRDIMAICSNLNGRYGDLVSSGLYDIVVAYLQSPEGRAEYIILDEDDVYRGKVLEKLNKSAEEILTEETSSNDFGEQIAHRLDINTFIGLYQNDPKWTRAVEDLANNPRLDIEYAYSDRYGDEIIFTHTVNGTKVSIGRMPRPRTMQGRPGQEIGGTGLVYVNYSGWRVDTYIDGNGNVASDFKDFLSNVFFNYNDPAVDAYAELKQAIVDYINTGDIQQAVTVFSGNSVIDALIQQSRADVKNGHVGSNPIYQFYDYNNSKWKPTDYKRMIVYMANVFRYTHDAVNLTQGSDIETIMRNNLNMWFRKLHNDNVTTIALLDLSPDKQPKFTECANVSDGEVNLAISVQDAKKEDAYQKCPVVSKALAPNTKARISIVSDASSGGRVLKIADSEIADVPISSYNPHTTMLSIIGPSGKPQPVHAFGRELTKTRGEVLDRDEPAGKILKAVLDTMKTLLTEVADAQQSRSMVDAEVAREKLYKFINSLVAGNGIGMFRAKSGQTFVQPVRYAKEPDRKGIEISYKPRNAAKAVTFHIYTSTGSGPELNFKVPGKSYNRRSTDVNEVLQQFIVFLSDNYQFDISERGINYDNDKLSLGSNNEIFVPQSNGKLAVIIGPNDNPIFREEYDSYNDFLIQNDLIRVNTQPVTVNGVDTNLLPTTDNQRGNRNILAYLPTVEAINAIANGPAQDRTQADNRVDTTSDTETFTALEKKLPTISEVKTQGKITSNAGEKLVEQVKVQQQQGEVTLAEVKQKAKAAGITTSLFPDRITYDPDFNSRETNPTTGQVEDKGQIAASNPDGTYSTYHHAGDHSSHFLPRGWVVVGNKLLNMLSSTNKARRNRGITKLMHERLHEIVHDPNLTPDQLAAWEGIGEVYNIFADKLNNDIETNETALKGLLGLTPTDRIDYDNLRQLYNTAATNARQSGDNELLAHLNVEFAKALDLQTLKAIFHNYAISANTDRNKARLLEEFTVEAMTNNLVYNYLNDTIYDGNNEILNKYGTDQTKETLFTKLINFIKELFGWKNIKDDSLYSKFYDVLRDFANSNYVEPEVTINENASQEGEGAAPPQAPDMSNLGIPGDVGNDAAIFDAPPPGFYDENEFDQEEDDNLFATVEESPAYYTGNHIESIDMIRRQLPIELQNNFDSLKDNGFIEFKCTK